MIGKTVSHYKIIDKIAEGGMGNVYKAQDLKLGRLAALKFITPGMKYDREALKRFEQEARAASALDHVNIATIYEIDKTTDGETFIAMTFYEGWTLETMLRQKSITIGKALDTAIQILLGLSKAHEAGIVHRDIKPSNIIVTEEGIVKIIDFGLAKLAGSSKITRTGITTGTIAYMSPEQAKGEDVDSRTDVFSLGIVLYEMLSGFHPFKGEYEAAIIHSIIYDEPEPVARHNPAIPQRLGEIVARSLIKNRDQRYQDAMEMANDLIDLRKSMGEGEKQVHKDKKQKRGLITALSVSISLAVIATAYLFYSKAVSEYGGLPFFERNREAIGPAGKTANKSEGPLALAVAPFWGQNEAASEEGRVIQRLLLRRLTEIISPDEKGNIIAVDGPRIPRSHAEAVSLGRDLGALMVIWGDVMIYEGEIEIQPNISIVRPLKDFENQSAGSLGFKLSDSDQLELRKEKAGRIGDTALFTAARYYKDTDPGRALSIVEKLPGTDSERFLLQGSILRGMGKSDEAIESYRKALELAPRSARPHLYLGDLYYRYLQRFSEADAEYRKAVDKEPDSPWTRLTLADFYLGFEEKREQALEEMEKALEFGPDNPEILRYAGEFFKNMGMYDRAIEQYKKAILLAPGSAETICLLGDAFEKKGDLDGAIIEYRKACEIAPSDNWPLYVLGNCYYRQKRYEEALEQYERAVALAPDEFPVYFALGNTYAKLGDRKKAVKYLERAFTLSQNIFEDLPHLFLGTNYIMLDMYDEAERELRKGISSGYYLDQFHYYLGYAYERTGKPAEAMREYELGAKAELDDSLKTGIANHLLYFLSLCRDGRQEEAGPFIHDLAGKLSLVDWKWIPETDMRTLDCYSGKIGVEDLLDTKAGGIAPGDSARPSCALRYYAAMAYILDIYADPDKTSVDMTKAIEVLENSIESCSDYDDFTLTGRMEMELDRLKRK